MGVATFMVPMVTPLTSLEELMADPTLAAPVDTEVVANCDTLKAYWPRLVPGDAAVLQPELGFPTVAVQAVKVVPVLRESAAVCKAVRSVLSVPRDEIVV